MEHLNIQIYQQLIGLAGLAGAAYLFTSGHITRALTAAGIALIAIADSFTWTLPGISPPPTFSIIALLDVVGVLAALVALMGTGLLSPNESSARSLPKSIWAALLYIVCCMSFWCILPTEAPNHYASLKDVTSFSDFDRKKFIALFGLSIGILLVIVILHWVLKKLSRDPKKWPWAARWSSSWIPFTCAVWLYLVIYLWQVTVPLLQKHDSRIERLKQAFDQTELVIASGLKCQTLRLSDDGKKALILFTTPGSSDTNQLVLEDNGFQQYEGEMQSGVGTPARIKVDMSKK